MPRLALTPADPLQALRLRRFLMGGGVYFMASALIWLYVWQGFMPAGLYANMFLVMLAVNLMFYLVFRCGLNLRFADPSLTLWQIVAATIQLMVVLYFVESGRGALLVFYLVTFVFGVFRLNTRQFLALNAFALLAYGGMIALLQLTRPQTIDLKLELLQWVALAFVLPSFALIGGYISQMRRKLHERNQELQVALQRIGEMAIRDELTGSHNRRYITEQLQHEQDRVSRLGGAYCVALMDLDHFKQVNDTYGHLVGDRVLKRVAECSPSWLRGADGFARYGGEEFLILMPRTRLEEAQAIAERLRSQIETIDFGDIIPGLRVTVSIGVAACQAHEPISKLLVRADTALYRAKAAGRNRALVDERG